MAGLIAFIWTLHFNGEVGLALFTGGLWIFLVTLLMIAIWLRRLAFDWHARKRPPQAHRTDD